MKSDVTGAALKTRHLIWLIGSFSVFVNLLMLVGPLYMLQVYDRVLSSRSVETLIALTALVAFLYFIMGLLDFARLRVASRIAARLQSGMEQSVFDAMLRQSNGSASTDKFSTGLRDLEAVQRLVSSPGYMVIFDLPWTPIFLFGIWLFHPSLGILALCGGALLIALAILNQISSRKHILAANHASFKSNSSTDHFVKNAEILKSLGMNPGIRARWVEQREEALEHATTASDVTGKFSSSTKTLRLFLQSLMLGLGAYLVLLDELTPGAMIVGSILLGRALAPVELAINQWAAFQAALKGWAAVKNLLTDYPQPQPVMSLPSPKPELAVENITVIAPGQEQACLMALSFKISPGTACGIIGHSGAGKSTLAKALTTAWKLAGGKIRLGGISIDQLSENDLAKYIGYLPQSVTLFEGSIAENIAALDPQLDSDAVVKAAMLADAHQMILRLPEGYDTQVSESKSFLSGGQIQRLGLARALYGDPSFVILDEPNSNLDTSGSQALNNAVRQLKSRGCAVLIIAHRPAALVECDTLLVLEHGTKTAFGPKDAILQKMVKNHNEIQSMNKKFQADEKA